MIKKHVAAYETTDGKLFLCLEEASFHQNKLDWSAWYDNNELYTEGRDGRDTFITEDEITKWLKEHKDSILAFYEVK